MRRPRPAHALTVTSSGPSALPPRRAALLSALAGLLIAATTTGCATESAIRDAAMTDLGCPDVSIDQTGQRRYLATGCGRAQDYVCTTQWGYRSQIVVCHPDVDDRPPVFLGSAVPPPPKPLLQPPAGAGGFQFGDSEEKVREACVAAGHAYTPDGQAGGSCDGLVAGVGAPARAKLTYCDGQLCEVSVRVEPAANENIGEAVARWKGALVDRYGGPTVSQIDVPLACRSDVIPCLRDGKSSVEFDWQWAAPTRISLSPKPEGDDRAAVEIGYLARPVGEKAPGL